MTKFRILSSICTATLIPLLFTGCGKAKKSQVVKEKWTITTLSENPIRLTKQDTECSDIFVMDNKIALEIPQFIDGEKVARELQFKGQINNNYVESIVKNPISQTIYNVEKNIIRNYTYGQDEDGEYHYFYEENLDSENVAKGTKLDVCPSLKSYDPFTFESSGLNISYSITKTHKKVAKHIGIDTLKPIEVSVAPIIFQDIKYIGGPQDKTGEKGYSTDNAYFDPNNLRITFLPQSERYQKKRGDVPFWQMPMVGSHEYGHHIFNTLIATKKSDNKSVIELQHSKRCFEHNAESNENMSIAGKIRANGAGFAIRSMNEGFADLIAFYTLSDDERKMTGIPCFIKNRDISSDEFGDDTKKIFTKNVLDIMNDSITEKTDSSCNTPSFQQAHHAGAVFAFSANQLLSSVTKDKDIKLKIILNWVKNLAFEHEGIKDLKSANYMFAALELMYKIALKETLSDGPHRAPQIGKKDCDIMEAIFPNQPELKCRFLK